MHFAFFGTCLVDQHRNQTIYFALWYFEACPPKEPLLHVLFKIFITSICGRHVYIYYTCAPAFHVWGLLKHGSEVEPGIIRYPAKYVFDLITRQTPRSQRIDYKVVVPTDFITHSIALRTQDFAMYHSSKIHLIWKSGQNLYAHSVRILCEKLKSVQCSLPNADFFDSRIMQKCASSYIWPVLLTYFRRLQVLHVHVAATYFSAAAPPCAFA